MNTERAQTGLDFLIGMSVFLIAIISIFAFLPSMFQPFTMESGPNMMVADRTAAQLTEETLASSNSPVLLETTVTHSFFQTYGSEENWDALNDELGVDSQVQVNISIQDYQGSVQSLTVDGSATTLEAGPPLPTTPRSVVASQRVVLLEGDHLELYVRVWER